MPNVMEECKCRPDYETVRGTQTYCAACISACALSPYSIFVLLCPIDPKIDEDGHLVYRKGKGLQTDDIQTFCELFLLLPDYAEQS